MSTKILKSSFVGLAVMIVLLPAPGYAAKQFQNFQKKKMEKVYIARLASSRYIILRYDIQTDARIQIVAEGKSFYLQL